MKKSGENWTPEDFQAHVEKVRESLQPSQALLQYLDRNRPDPLKRSIPFGVISRFGDVAPGQEEHIAFRPWLTMRPYQLVVSSETAAAFDLLRLQVGVSAQTGNGDPIPLETFDVAFFGENSAMHAIQWDCDAVDPGMDLFLHVRNRGPEPRPFRGVLWGRIL